MAHRKPVVAHVAGGLPDMVKPGVNGWLGVAGDAAELASAIAEAVAQPARLVEMGARSRALVEAEFAWSALVARQLAVYDEVRNRS
jgi:glycosyltransferase involved in cell wall biosynthesis